MKPWRSLQERLVDEALERALAPRDALVASARAVQPQQRFGFREEPLSIYDVLDLKRFRAPSQWETMMYRSNWAGTSGAEINASARNAGGGVPGST